MKIVPVFSDFCVGRYKQHAKIHLRASTGNVRKYPLATLIDPNRYGKRYGRWPKDLFNPAREAAAVKGGPHTCCRTTSPEVSPPSAARATLASASEPVTEGSGSIRCPPSTDATRNATVGLGPIEVHESKGP